MSTLSTRFNPDLLTGGTKSAFVRGNEYFSKTHKVSPKKKRERKISSKEDGEDSDQKKNVNKNASDSEEKEESGSDVPMIPKKDNPEDMDTDDEQYERMRKMKGQRYWAEENPTIKCHNCLQFGHMQADCPNERKKQKCILCGKEGHDSFDCTEKMCFKCNKVGHQAKDCKETKIKTCRRCNQVGHKEDRCLKVWNRSSFQ